MVSMYNTEGVLVGLLMPSRTGKKQEQTLYIEQAPLRIEEKHFIECHSSRFLWLDYRSVEPSSFFWAYFVFRESGGIWLWCPSFLQGLCITCNAGHLCRGDNWFSWVKPAQVELSTNKIMLKPLYPYSRWRDCYRCTISSDQPITPLTESVSLIGPA